MGFFFCQTRPLLCFLTYGNGLILFWMIQTQDTAVSSVSGRLKF